MLDFGRAHGLPFLPKTGDVKTQAQILQFENVDLSMKFVILSSLLENPLFANGN